MAVAEVTKRMTLYDLTIEGLQIADMLTENEGELTPELEARLDALMQAGPERLEAAAMVVRNIEADALVCKAEADRLAERALSYEKNAKRLKDRIAIALDAAFNGKVKTAKFTLWTQQAQESMSIELSEEFTLEQLEQDHPGLVKTEKSIDTAAVRRLIAANRAALDKASAVLADPEATEEQTAAAKEALAVIPEALDIEIKPGKRYARIK